jgi:hypothetical protein
LALAALERVTDHLEHLQMVVILFFQLLLQLAAAPAAALQLMATMDEMAAPAAVVLVLQALPRVLVLHRKVMQVALVEQATTMQVVAVVVLALLVLRVEVQITELVGLGELVKAAP